MGSGTITDELGVLIREHERRLAMARQIASTHFRDGGLCSCMRPWPCYQAASLESLGTEIESAIGALVGPTLMIPAIDDHPSRPINARFVWRWLRGLGVRRRTTSSPTYGME